MKFANYSNIAIYSENPKALRETLKDVEVTFKVIRQARNKYGVYLVYDVTVSREDKSISFEFSDSIVHYSEGIDPDVYSILCCMGSDGLIDVSSFENFCSEFGYNPDSIKDNALYEKCKEQHRKIHTLFTDAELENFPG